MWRRLRSQRRTRSTLGDQPEEEEEENTRVLVGVLPRDGDECGQECGQQHGSDLRR